MCVMSCIPKCTCSFISSSSSSFHYSGATTKVMSLAIIVRSMFMRATLPYNINCPTRLTPQARLLMSSQKRKRETHNPHKDDGHNQARLSNNFQHRPIVTMSIKYSTSKNSLRIAHLKGWPNGQKKPAQGAYTQVCKTTHIYSLYFQTLAPKLLSLRAHC